jgi:hypothetical protein
VRVHRYHVDARGPIMLPKSVSPRVVYFLAMPLFFLLLISLFSLERRLFKLLIFEDGMGGTLVILAYLASYYLARKGLVLLGIQVRSRSVERFQAVEHHGESEGAVEWPIRIIHGEGLIRVTSAAFYLGGLVCFVLAWFPLLAELKDPWVMTLVMLGSATILMGLGFLAGRARPDSLCEFSDEGIRAPDGLWGRMTFVPWGDLARCEIIHDDETAPHDYFLLWDRSGRLRFRRSKHWAALLRRGEREKIFRVLRTRFPRKAKPDHGPEPAPAAVTASAVWDRELDG